MTTETYISIDTLRAQVYAAFAKSGVRPETARSVTDVIVAGERDNCKSHGIYRIEGCLRSVASGKANPTAVPVLKDSRKAIIEVDAAGGFSCPAYNTGRPTLIERAKELGMASLVIRDALHFSALWYEVEDLARTGLAVISMCPSYAFVAPAGGTTPLFGTNPFAFGYPRKGTHPYVFDFATSVAARGDMEMRRIAGEPIPEGWAIAPDGSPTTDAGEGLAGAMLPFGSHKGSAISSMIELMAGAMLGEFMSKEALDFAEGGPLPRHGALIIAFDPARFAHSSGRDPVAEGEVLINAMTDQGARLPSERRYAARKTAHTHGVLLSETEITRLEAFAARGLGALDH